MPSSSPLTGPSKKRGESALEKRSAESQALAGHSTAASSKPTAPSLAPQAQQQLQQEPSVAGFAVTRTGQDASPPRPLAGDSEPKPARRTSRTRTATSAPGGGYTPPDEHGSSALVAAAVDALSFRTASSGLSAAALQQEGVGVSESSSTVSSLLGPRLHHYAAPPSPRRQGAEAHGRPTHPRSHTAPTTTGGGGRGGSAPLGGPHRDPFAVGSEPDFSRFPAPPPPRMMRHLTEAVAAAAAHAAPPPALFTPPHSAAHRRSTRRGRVVASSAGVDRPPVNSPAERLKDTQGEKLKEREGEDGAPTLYSDPARGPTAERGQRHHPQRVGGGEAGETVESMPHPVTPLTSHEESVRSSVGGKKRRSLTSHSSETDSGGRRSHPPSSAVVPLQSTANKNPDGSNIHHYGPRRRSSSSGGDGDTARSSISGTSSRHGEPASRRHSSVSSSDTHSTATARRGSTGSITSLLEHAPSLDVPPPTKSAAGHRNRHGRTSKNGTATTHSGGGGRRASNSSGSGSSSSTGSSTSDHNHNNDSSSTSPSTTTMSSRSHSQQQQRRRGGGRAVADSRDRRDNSPPVTARLPNAPLSRRPVVSWRSPARVCAIASVPAGQVLTGGDPSGLIEVWDSRTGRRLCGLGGHQAPVMSLLTVPNSSLLLSGSADRTARLWELRTLQNTLVLEGHRGLIKALASLWMPDVGLNLFTGSDDGTVRQWRAATGVCVHVYRGHRGPVNVVTCLRPVRLIATGGCDGVMKLWNAQTLRCLSSIAAVPSSGTATSGGAAAASAGVGGGAAAGVGGSGSGGGGGGGGGTSTAYGATGGVTGRTAGGSGGARWAGLSSDDGAGHRRHGADADGRDAGGEGDSWNTSGAVWDIAQLEDAQQSIATATDDGAVRLWIMQINQQAFLAKELYLPGVLLKARSGARCLLACGAYVFVGGARGELYVWDTAVLPYVQVGGHHTDRRGSVLQTAGAVAYRVLAPVGQRPAGGGANAGIGGSSNTHTGSHAGGGGGGGGGVGLAAGAAAAAGHSNKNGTATVVQRSTSFTSTSGSSAPALSSTNARPSPSPSMTSVSVSTATVATNASGGAAAAADGADGTAGGETYEAAFFFHTAAITGLTRQGAQLTSSSLDHNVCRWDLHEVLPTDTALGMPVLAEQGMGGVGGPPASGQEGVSSPFSWAMRQPSSAAWDFDEGGAYPRSASTASLARWPVDGQAWALDGGGAASAGAAAVVAAAAAAARAPLSASSLSVAGAASSSSGTITTTTTTAAAAQAPTAFASPLALLRNPRRIMEGDAVGAGTEMGTSDSTVTALSPGEAAAAYSELPLVFVVQHLRTAAASPLDIRYLVRTLLLVLLVTFFSLLYGAALQPMVQHGGDITMGLLSQTATYPLPSFARPQTFASITGPESLVRWLLLMVDQLHSLSTPVHILVPALENETGGDVEGESSDSDRSSDASRDSTGTDDSGGTTTTTNNRALSSSRTTAVAATAQAPLAAQSLRSRELGDSVAAGDDSWWSSSSNSSDSGSNADEGAPPFRRLPPAPLPSQTKLLVVPALPGGVVLLRHLTLRVKHVTDTSCTWNPHFLRQRASADATASSSTLSSSSSASPSSSSAAAAAAATMAPPPCYGALQADTESRATICPNANITALLPRLGPNLTGFPASTPTSCLAHSHAAVGVSYKGYFHHYDGAGYAVQLPLFLNSVTTNALYAPIEAVRRLGLVDNQRTRLVDVLLYTYHIHTKMFFRTHYVLEVPRGGAWIGSVDARPCPVYGLSSDISPRLFVACVAILLAVVLGLLAMVLYDLIMAFYVGELMRYLCSLLVLMDMGVVVMGLAVVGAALRWIAVSRSLHLVTLLRASAAAAKPPAATVDGTVADLLMNSISPEYDTQIAHLNRVESAVSYLLIFAAAEAVLLLVSAATIISRHIGFVQTVTATIRQLRVQMLTAVVMMVLALTAFALSFRLLFGARVYAYASVGRGLWHLLLYFVAPTSVHMDAGPLLAELRPTAGKLLLLVLNYLCRVLCYVYWLALLMERLKAVSRNSPHISFRAFCAKWWYDVQYQLALMRQLAPNTVFLTGDADAEDGSPSKLKGQAASGRDTSAAGGGGGGAVASRASAAAAASEERASTRRAHLSFSGHRAVIIEHLWRRLRRLQQEQEDARHARMRRHMSSSAAAASAAAATMTLSSSPVEKSGLSNSNSTSSRTRTGAAKGGDTATMTPPPPPPPPQPASAGAAADAAPAYVHVRLTDLLLLLPEDARTPFARNVVRHAWDTLAWMYHYHQQHTLQQFPDEQERRVRLEEGIRDAQRQLEPLFAAVRATQARLEAHEARLRPLAQAVMGMSAGTR